MTANVAGYLLQLLAASWLGVEGYSEFASLLAVQLLCAVPALAMQNVVAREVVRGASSRAVRAMMWRCAALVAAVAVVLIPMVVGLLDVGVWAAAGALGAAPALVILSGEQGILQGGNHFRALATVLAMAGTARVAPALLALALGGGAAGALWAGAAGIVGAAIVAGRIARGTTAPAADSGAGDSGQSALTKTVGVVPVLRAVQVQAALMALSSVDLIVVRVVLDEVDASRYSLGTIATKIAFWLPQAVGVVLYPRMAEPTHSARAIRDALSVLSAIGVVAVLGAALAAPLAPLFAGADYAPIQGLLWLFALHGAILAVLQGALLSAIAVERTALAAVTWIGLAVEVGLMLAFARTIESTIGTAVSVAAVTTTIVAAVVLRAARTHPAPANPILS
ncbi:polysaccharide biosynthesis protein [Nocardia alba]|uniref:O-antigen/teichoic acid export membrane protein n=1 Tax=Nocardia alba TaxID=225051 RepID=A0A4R1G2N4_9NOCA|nr:polysaccharide biosynthesis protein [Nocardia alba]TCK00593.1 O-antigen/teichoic acid export membrane protein [Nocardia alba]